MSEPGPDDAQRLGKAQAGQRCGNCRGPTVAPSSDRLCEHCRNPQTRGWQTRGGRDPQKTRTTTSTREDPSSPTEHFQQALPLRNATAPSSFPGSHSEGSSVSESNKPAGGQHDDAGFHIMRATPENSHYFQKPTSLSDIDPYIEVEETPANAWDLIDEPGVVSMSTLADGVDRDPMPAYYRETNPAEAEMWSVLVQIPGFSLAHDMPDFDRNL